MSVQNLFGDLALDATVSDLKTLTDQVRALNDTMLYFTTAILEKMPILDLNDRAMVRLGAIDGSLTLSTIGTLANLTGGNTALIPYQMAPIHIYDNIKVS